VSYALSEHVAKSTFDVSDDSKIESWSDTILKMVWLHLIFYARDLFYRGILLRSIESYEE